MYKVFEAQFTSTPKSINAGSIMYMNEALTIFSLYEQYFLGPPLAVRGLQQVLVLVESSPQTRAELSPQVTVLPQFKQVSSTQPRSQGFSLLLSRPPPLRREKPWERGCAAPFECALYSAATVTGVTQTKLTIHKAERKQ